MFISSLAVKPKMRVCLSQASVSFPYGAVALHKSHTGVAKQQHNLQPYTTRHSITFLTFFVKEKTKGAGIPPQPKDLGSCPNIR